MMAKHDEIRRQIEDMEGEIYTLEWRIDDLREELYKLQDQLPALTPEDIADRKAAERRQEQLEYFARFNLSNDTLRDFEWWSFPKHPRFYLEPQKFDTGTITLCIRPDGVIEE